MTRGRLPRCFGGSARSNAHGLTWFSLAVTRAAAVAVSVTAAVSLWVTASVALSKPAATSAQAGSPPPSSSASPTITPRPGRSFAPTLGDWEGTAAGFPASFELSLAGVRATSGYALNHVVALRPDRCPTTPGRYSEAVIEAARGLPVSPKGALDLERFGFGGRLHAPRAATLTAGYRSSGACSGKLVWHMHPVRRRSVDDGVWRLRFGDGETGRFHVLAGGRLVSSIRLPSALARCNGATGAIDLFIAASGLAQVSQPDVRAAIRFRRRTAIGTVDSGGRGCPGGPLHLTASL